MRVIKGEEGCKHSWQDNFPITVSCGCGSKSHIAFVAIENSGEQDGYICDKYRPDNAHLWPHDAIAVAVYICSRCMKTKSIMNQA